MDQNNKTLIIRTASILTIITAVLVIVGWFLHNPILISIIPGFSSMKTNTALCFILSGLSLYLSSTIVDPKSKRLFSNLFAIVAGSIALITLIQYPTVNNFGIDELLIKDYTNSGYKGRMAPLTAISFILINIAVLLSRRGKRHLDLTSQTLLHICTFIGALAALGYIYGIPSLYKLDLITSMALHTSVLFIILSISATFLQSNIGITGLFTGKLLGNKIARKIFPTMMFALLILAFVRIYLHRHHLISIEFASALMAICILMVLLFQINLTASYLNKTDRRRAEAEGKLKEANDKLKELVAEKTIALSETTQVLKIATEGAEIGIWEQDYTDNTIIGNDIYYSNLGFATNAGKLKTELIQSMVDTSNEGYNTDEFKQRIHTDKEIDIELIMNTLHNGKRYFRFKGIKFFDNDGKLIKMIGAQWDITHFKEVEKQLKASLDLSKRFIEGAPTAIAMFDNEMKYLAVSEKWCEDYKLIKTEIIGKSNYEVFPNVSDERKKIHQEVLNGDISKGEETYFERHDGTGMWISWDMRPWYISEGVIGGMFIHTIDITEKRIAQQKLKEILHLTESQNDRLKNFANIVSHNLRTHSSNIEMLNGLFFNDHPEYKEQEIPKMIAQATENLKETVDHLSEVAVLNRNDTQQLITVNLSKTINKAINSITALSMNAGVSIINEVADSMNILGIPAYTDSIVLNFLTNAIKYRSEERDSFVKISLTDQDDFCVLKIEDNGQGIDMAKHGDHLFGMYKTFHKHEDSKGIGLYITKNQVESMGGHIEVESQVNVGTMFKIYFKKTIV